MTTPGFPHIPSSRPHGEPEPYGYVPEPRSYRPVGDEPDDDPVGPPPGVLHAVPDQSGVWAVDGGSYVEGDSYAAPTGHARVWSSDGSGWSGSLPVVRDLSDPRRDPPWSGTLPAVVDGWSPERRPSQEGWPAEDGWPADGPGPASSALASRVEPGPPAPAQPHAWPIDRPLTGAFPTVPAWGTPLRVAGVRDPYLSRRDLSGRAASDARTRAGVTAAGWALLVLVGWTWVGGGAVDQLMSGQTVLVLRATGHLTALLASSLLLVQMVLMARLPALENTLGRDRLVRVHALCGFGSFALMLAHIALATLAYAAAHVDRVLPTFWELTWTYPGMLLAVAGTLLLVLVVVTSRRRARRRIRYESWHLLHLYAYLGAGLALPHQLWTGKDFLRSPALTACWWTVWGVAVAVTLLWRVLIPLSRSFRHDIRVAAVVREGSRTVSVYLTGRRLDDLAEAGQFLVWRFLDRPGWIRANPYSVSAAPQPDRLRITVREAGDGSRSLADLEPGTRVLVEGAYGRLTARARTHRRVALIGAGSGMAPLRSLAEGLSYAPGEAILIERYTDGPFLPQEVDWLARERGLGVARLGGRRRGPDSWVGEGYDGDSDADVVRGWIPDLEERDVFLCGAAPWAESVRRALYEAGLPPDQLHSEVFGW